MDAAPEPNHDDVSGTGGAFRFAWLRALGFGLLFGVVTGVSQTVPDLWWMGLTAPMALIWLAVRPGMRPSRAGFWAAIGVMPWWGWSHAWVVDISSAGVAPLVIYLSLWTMLFVWIGGRVVARLPGMMVVSLPTLWVGLEFLRGSVLFSGYAWFLAGHPSIESPGAGLAFPAAWGGAYLVSWLVVLGSTLAVCWSVPGLKRPALGLAVPGAVLWLLWFVPGVAGWFTPASGEGPTLRVAVVQSNVPQSNKIAWGFTQRYLDWLDLKDLTIEAASYEPDVIVWPETMFPGLTLDPESVEAERAFGLAWPIDRAADPRLDTLGDLTDSTSVVSELLALQRGLGIPMLIGATGHDGFEIASTPQGEIDFRWDAQHNSVFLIRNGAVRGARYNKMVLMPFGEVMPYVSAWPWLEKQLLAIGAEGMSFTLDAGAGPVWFEIDTDGASGGVATPICFEATMPAVGRRLVFEDGRRRANLLVNPSNDGWFGDSVAMREYYLRSCRWRSAELATPMVRACNTGISAVIDARGRLVADTLTSPAGARAHASGVLVEDVTLGRGTTIYGVWGWLVDLVYAAGLVLTLAAGFLLRPAESPNTDTASPEEN
ncbi:MAG: apolipoprotein N-acyltransferase [Phycisphaerales bacterium JB040]